MLVNLVKVRSRTLRGMDGVSDPPLVVEAWRALCGDGAALPAPVTFTGDEAVLASVFPVTRLGAAAVLASLLAASHLQAVRTGAPAAPVELDAAHLACAVRSERFLALDGQPFGSAFAPLSRFVRTADGWIRLHANYAWHRERLLRVLGTSDAPESVAAAVLLALAWRQRVGRGWHIRLSLAQTAAWLLRQARRPKRRVPDVDPRPFLVELDAADGRVTLVTPPGRLGGRPLAWPAPPPRYGADPPAWRTDPVNT